MTKKILVVDDDKDLVSILLRRLEAYGYEAASAGNGEEALRAVKKERFDLIILDIMMPVMDGTELGQILKDDPKTKDIPLIFLTALQTKQEHGGHSVMGSNIIFAKPFEFKELAGNIDTLLKRCKG